MISGDSDIYNKVAGCVSALLLFFMISKEGRRKGVSIRMVNPEGVIQIQAWVETHDGGHRNYITIALKVATHYTVGGSPRRIVQMRWHGFSPTPIVGRPFRAMIWFWRMHDRGFPPTSVVGRLFKAFFGRLNLMKKQNSFTPILLRNKEKYHAESAEIRGK